MKTLPYRNFVADGNYRSPMKFQEGNVFSRVSVCPQRERGELYPRCLGPTIQGCPPPTVQEPLSLPWSPFVLVTSGGQDHRHVQTCSLGEHIPDIWWLATKAGTVDRRLRAVRILLECSIVYFIVSRIGNSRD